MKIGIYLEGSPEMGGGFFQSLKASLLFLGIKKYSSEIELIITFDCKTIRIADLQQSLIKCLRRLKLL